MTVGALHSIQFIGKINGWVVGDDPQYLDMKMQTGDYNWIKQSPPSSVVIILFILLMPVQDGSLVEQVQ